MAQQALPPGAVRRRAAFGLLDADGWTWAGVKAAFWEGSFAGFAAIIAASRLYVGYDSAGQHVAAACGVPSSHSDPQLWMV